MNVPLPSALAASARPALPALTRTLPKPIVDDALRSPVTRRAVVTAIGRAQAPNGRRREGTTAADELVVLLCTEGAGWVEHGGARLRVTAGHCMVIPPATAHASTPSADDPWTIRWCSIRGDDVVDFAAATSGASGPEPIRLRSPDRAATLFDEVLTHVDGGQTPAHLRAASGAAWHLLAQLVADRVLPARGTPLELAIRHLEDRLDEPLRVAEVAELVGLSPSHLTAQFRQATGGGVIEHHTALRMARARYLLDTASAPIAHVARAVGYDDPLYFSRRFRAVHGMSPSDYRAQHKG